MSFLKSLRSVLKNRQILLCAIAATTSFGALLAYASFWYSSIQTYYLTSSQDELLISAMIFAGIGIGTPLLGWLSNRFKSRNLIIHTTLVLGNMMLLLCIYLPHFNFNSLMIIKIISFLTGFLLSGSMLFYTVVSEISSDTTRGMALSITNTGVFLFNTLLLFVPYLFITEMSKFFFTYLWILPFSILISILFTYFIKESYSYN
jgi:MFS family permease